MRYINWSLGRDHAVHRELVSGVTSGTTLTCEHSAGAFLTVYASRPTRATPVADWVSGGGQVLETAAESCCCLPTHLQKLSSSRRRSYLLSPLLLITTLGEKPNRNHRPHSKSHSLMRLHVGLWGWGSSHMTHSFMELTKALWRRQHQRRTKDGLFFGAI